MDWIHDLFANWGYYGLKSDIQDTRARVRSSGQRALANDRRLESKIHELATLNGALCELLVQKGVFTEAELRAVLERLHAENPPPPPPVVRRRKPRRSDAES
ncbi:MAG: hypothetical protein GC161_17725 [Planctomycetaceae bacterium]|nr:hypothetical protein [Planctomycetaceae bacterium]